MSGPEHSDDGGNRVPPPPPPQEAAEVMTTVPPAALDGRVGRYRLCYELARGGMATGVLGPHDGRGRVWKGRRAQVHPSPSRGSARIRSDVPR